MRITWIKSFLVVWITCCCVGGCNRNANDPLARGWQRIGQSPLPNAPILYQAAHSPCVWTITETSGSIRITDHQAAITRPPRHEIRLDTPAGTLVGDDRGEYGGGLTLLGPNRAPVRQLLTDNVIQLLPVKSGALIVTGLLHLSIDRGALWLFYKDQGGRWSVKKIADLDGHPSAIYNKNGRTVIVTGHGVSRVNQKSGARETASLPFAQTYPNSVAEDTRGQIYIGMNAFVVRLIPTKTGYADEWFTKPRCLDGDAPGTSSRPPHSSSPLAGAEHSANRP